MAKILIIDDDPAVSRTLARMLALDRHEVGCVEAVSQAMQRVATERPDAVLLDMRLPIDNGLDFLRQLRRDPRFSLLPVGIVTGDYFLTDEVLAEIAGLNATVRYKPVWLADLSKLMTLLLAGSKDATAS